MTFTITTEGPIRYLAAFVIVCAASFAAAGQIRNNPYSPSPAVARHEVSVGSAAIDIREEIKYTKTQTGPTSILAPSTPLSAPTGLVTPRTVNPTEIYKVAPGDVLLINLKNSPQGTGLYPVRSDGSIDYPLAGGNISVAGRTTSEISKAIASGVKLFASPQVDVKMHQFQSHRITVSGLVNNGGEIFLQREAMPLYVIRAEVGVSREAIGIGITRSRDGKPTLYLLSDRETDNLLIFPGDRLVFVSEMKPVK